MEKKLKGICIFLIVWFFIPGIPNPLSHLVVGAAADMYIQKNYPGESLRIDEINYNFTDGVYSAHITRSGSVDSDFIISIETWGRVINDGYEDNVKNGQNTALRLTKQYYDTVREIFPDRTYHDGGYLYIHGDISYSSRDSISPMEELDAINPYYSFITDDAVIDYEYDISTLGSGHGTLGIDYTGPNISYQKSAEILLWAKEEMDKAGIGFYAVNLSLRVPPSGEHGERLPSDASIYIISFPYSEIYPERLEKRIEYSYKELYEYWNEPITYLGEE
ncbi:MAG: hypothetical protein IKM61_01630 [Eubacteriaceae bacterium]|nr:hypothetical protein [Eubacteriaceae bacterium]